MNSMIIASFSIVEFVEYVADATWLQKLAIIAILAVALFFLMILFSPREMLKFIAFLLSHSFLRVRIYGAENIPNSGPVLLVANHVSVLDLLMLQGICHNRLR